MLYAAIIVTIVIANQSEVWIGRERSLLLYRNRSRAKQLYVCCMCVYIYIYIYMSVYIYIYIYTLVPKSESREAVVASRVPSCVLNIKSTHACALGHDTGGIPRKLLEGTV